MFTSKRERERRAAVSRVAIEMVQRKPEMSMYQAEREATELVARYGNDMQLSSQPPFVVTAETTSNDGYSEEHLMTLNIKSLHRLAAVTALASLGGCGIYKRVMAEINRRITLEPEQEPADTVAIPRETAEFCYALMADVFTDDASKAFDALHAALGMPDDEGE